ncbi:hypothetical protein BGZ97_001039 [Linnemannia gamsii]|uniref:Uncharacterized protein n=1 Tax=Linnemannia gamsii TaxID=64522 RepID=A0A9P6QZ95_9FUNG|nr:hypothetical protein BGZ97_001039 [Linnemannia gamsii]
MDVLRFGRVNMDLQYNEGDRAKYYMCKYVTEQAGPKQVTIVTDKDKIDASAAEMSSSNEHRSSKEYSTHFHYRSVGVVEAVMDICGWKMHGVMSTAGLELGKLMKLISLWLWRSWDVIE